MCLLLINKMSNLKELNKIDKKKYPHITLSEENYQKLRQLGTCGDSFNDVIGKILSQQEVNK